MKGQIVFLTIFVNVFCNVYTQNIFNDNFDIRFIVGNFGGGMNFRPDGYDFEVSASLANFFLIHSKTNIGLGISPLKYSAYYSVNEQEWNQNLYFLNGNLFWNTFDIKNIILGPFISVNYFGIKNWSEINKNDYIFSSGLMFILRKHIADGKYPFQIIGAEVGYRNISGKNGFYFNVNLDISIFVGLIIGTMQGQASDIIEANEDYERNRTGPFVPKEPKK